MLRIVSGTKLVINGQLAVIIGKNCHLTSFNAIHTQPRSFSYKPHNLQPSSEIFAHFHIVPFMKENMVNGMSVSFVFKFNKDIFEKKVKERLRISKVNIANQIHVNQ